MTPADRTSPATDDIVGVLFDLGGVVLDSPLHAIADFEQEQGIPIGFVNRQVVASAPHGAWHRLERGELAVGDEFFTVFDRELAAAGHALSSRDLMARIAAIARPRPVMLTAIDRLRESGYAVGALTNNWAKDDEHDDASSPGQAHPELGSRFDVVIESRKVGLRKPDPAIYRLACDALEVAPEQTAFLDDIGANLKTARQLGMHTIKVVEPVDALEELGALLGLELVAEPE